MLTLFGCCVHRKDVAGIRGRNPPEAETLLAFGRAMEAANFLAL